MKVMLISEDEKLVEEIYRSFRESWPRTSPEKAEVLMEGRGQVYIAQRCFRCETGEDQAPLLPVRHKGHSLWVCTRCLPALIHG